MISSTEVRPTAWLYTRGDASVSMRVEEQPQLVTLVVRGPGSAAATHEFGTLAELMVFADAEDRRLRNEGFHLQAVAERRRGEDRRGPGTPDRRRR